MIPGPVTRQSKRIRFALALAITALLALGGFAFGQLSTDNFGETSVSDGTSTPGG